MVALGDLAKVRDTNLVAALFAESNTAIDGAAAAPHDERAGKGRGRRSRPAAPGESSTNAVAALARLLPYQLPDKLKSVRSELSQFTTNVDSADLRQNAWAALAL